MEMPSRHLVVVVAILAACAAAGCSVAYAAGSYMHRVFGMDAHVPCLVQHLATAEECAQLIADAEAAGFKRSTVVDDAQPVTASRTSSHVFLKESEVAETLKDRVSAFLGIPTTHFENAQVVRYRPGEKYDAHYDAAFRDASNTKTELPRLYTIMLYLNDDYEGGHTEFPNCGADVTPHRGTGVLWRNLSEAGRILKSSLHAGRPVTAGTKYVCTIWIHGTPLAP
jgi:prolyl 4-hydroxylase